MKSRHAAALALVGWYLMVPPRDGSTIDTKAPLAQWENWSSFDSAAECESAAKRDERTSIAELKNPALRERTRKREHPHIDPATNVVLDDQALDEQCIATDDPRLKSN